MWKILGLLVIAQALTPLQMVSRLIRPKRLETFIYSHDPDSPFFGTVHYAQLTKCVHDIKPPYHSMSSLRSCMNTFSPVIVRPEWFDNIGPILDEYMAVSIRIEANRSMFEHENDMFEYRLAQEKTNIDAVRRNYRDMARKITSTLDRITEKHPLEVIQTLLQLNSSTTNLQNMMELRLNKAITMIETEYNDSSTITSYLSVDEHRERDLKTYLSGNLSYIINTILSPRSLYTCSAGHYCPSESEQIACPAGTLQPYLYETTKWSCQYCSVGQYSPNSGSPSCTTCSHMTSINATTC